MRPARYRRLVSGMILISLGIAMAAPVVSSRTVPAVAFGDLERGPIVMPRKAPCVALVSPRHGDTDVPLNTPIIIRFCRAVDPSTVAITISPALAFTASWSVDFRVLTLISGLLPACTLITIVVMVEGMESFTFWFTTKC